MCDRWEDTTPVASDSPGGEVRRCPFKALEHPAMSFLPASKILWLRIQNPYHPLAVVKQEMRLATCKVSRLLKHPFKTGSIRSIPWEIG